MLGAAGLTVDSLSPDALCPPIEETRRAVAARLGSVELEGTWHATYLLVHRRQGDFVSLSLHDPEGVLRLQRDLPVRGGSCATLAPVIALVLERFFLRPEAPPEQEPSPPPTIAAPRADESTPPARVDPPPSRPAKPAGAALAPVRSPPPPARPFRASASLWATTSWIAPSLGLRRAIAGPYGASVGVGFDLNEHETRAFEGAVFMRRAPLSLAVDRQLRLAPAATASAAIELLGVLEDARPGHQEGTGGGLRIVPGVGGRVGLTLFPEAAVQPFAQLTAAWLVRHAAPAFQVEPPPSSAFMDPQEVMVPPTLVFGVAIGIVAPL
jgi:hypothetical protein